MRELSEDALFRFGGIARLYGRSALEAFQNSHVSVIGVGGVGSWAAESLARSGIGEISLFDLDDVCVSNINRQVIALDSTVGQMKVDVLKRRLIEINPNVTVNAHHKFVTSGNLEKCINSSMDYVFEATDSVKSKTAIIAYCVRNKIRVITSGGAGGQIDPSQIKVSDLSKTIQDPLLSKVRNQLRKQHGFTSNPKRRFRVDSIYSTEPVRYDQGDGTVCHERPGESGPVRLDCASGFGSVTHITSSFGLFASARILEKLARATLV